MESVVGTEMLSHRTEVKSSAPSRAQRLAHTGDLFYQTVRPYQKNNYLFEKPDNNYVFSTGYAQMRPYVDGYFLLSLVQSERFVKVVLDNCTGTSYPAINANDLAEIEVAAPSDESEAQKIGTIFRSIDNLITLHQRKCANLCSPSQVVFSLLFATSTFSWEQRKLGELVDRVVRKNINNESTLPLTISAQYGLVDQITYFNNRVASRDVSNYYLVLNGEFAYNKSTSDGYPFGAVKRLDLYEKGVLSTLYIVFAPKKEQQIDSDYLTVFFDTDRWHKGVAERADEGVRNHGLLNISAEDFFDIDLSVPKDIVEQKQIGAFIRQLDNLITLHQRECISFTGRADRLILTANKKRTTSSWEQRKLEDYLTVSVEKNTGNIYGRSDVLSVSGDYGIVNQIEFQGRSFAGASVSNYGVVQTGDVVYTKSPLNSNPYGIIKTNKGKPGIVSTLYAVYHPKENAFSDFIQVYFEQHARMNNYMHPLVNKGAKNDMKVSAENALKGPVCFPSRIEQESVSAFFSVLDNLITLHQRKPFLMKWRTSDANRNQTNRLVL